MQNQPQLLKAKPYCPDCDSQGWIIVQVQDLTSRIGFHQEAKHCSCRLLPAIDSKMAAAGESLEVA